MSLSFGRSDKENRCLLLGPPGRDVHGHQRSKSHREGVESECKPKGTRYFPEKRRALLVSKPSVCSAASLWF